MNFPSNINQFDILTYLGIDSSQFNSELNKSDKKADEVSKKIQKGLNVAMGAASAIIGAATIQAAKFESKLSDVETLLGPGSQNTIQQYSQELLRMSNQIPLDIIDDFGTGLYQIVSATVPLNDQVNALESSSKAAIAGVAGLTETFNLGSSIVKGYGFEWSQLDAIYDVVFKTIEQGQTTMGELASSMGGAVPIAATMGIEFQELAGAMATLAGVTGTTSEAATQIEGTITALIKPTKDLEIAFNDMGVASGQELIAKMGGLGGALDAIRNYTEKNNIEIGKLIGRKEALVGFYSLTGAQAEDFANKTLMMYNATGAANDAFEIQMQTLENQAKLFKNIVQSAFIEFGQNRLLPMFTNILNVVNKNPEAIKGTIDSLANLAIEFGTVAGAIKVVTIAMNATPFGLMVTAIGGVTAGLIAMSNAVASAQSAELEKISSTSDHIESIYQLTLKYEELTGKTNLSKIEQNELAGIETTLATNFGLTKDALHGYNGELDTLLLKQVEIKKNELEASLSEVNDKLNDMSESSPFWTGALMSLGLAFGDVTAFTESNKFEQEKLQKQAEALQTEIDELSGMMDKSAGSMGRLNIKTGELNAGLNASNPIIKATTDLMSSEPGGLSGEIRGILDPLELANQGFVDAKTSIGNLKQPIIDVSTSFGDELASSIETVYDWTGRYGYQIGDIVQKMGGMNGTVNEAVGALGRIVNSGFDPVTIALESVNFVLGLFQDENERIVLTIDEVKTALGELGLKIDDANDKINSLEFTSPLLQQLQGQIDITLQAMTSASDDMFVRLGDSIQDFVDRIDILLQPFELTFEVDDAVGNLNTLVSESLNAFNRLGEAANIGSLNALIVAQVEESLKLLDTLDPMSEAYKELKESIDDAYSALDMINQGMGSSTTVIEDQISYYENLIRIAQNNMNTVFSDLGDYSNYDEGVAKVEALQEQIRKYQDQIDALRESLKNAGDETDDMTDSTIDFNDAVSAGTYTIEEINQMIADGLIPTFSNAADQFEQTAPLVDDFGESIDKSTAVVRGFNTELGQLNFNLDSTVSTLFGGFEGFESNIRTISDYLNQLLYFNVDLSTTNLDEQIGLSIENLLSYVEDLDPLSDAFGDSFDKLVGLLQLMAQSGIDITPFRDRIRELYNPIAETGDAINIVNDAIPEVTNNLNDMRDVVENVADEYNYLNRELGDLIINWEETLKVLFDDYTGFEQDMKAAQDAIEQLLYFRIDLDTTDADEQIAAAIARMLAFLHTLNPGSQAYVDASESINDLINQFVSMGGDIEYILTLMQEIENNDIDIDVNVNDSDLDDLRRKLTDFNDEDLRLELLTRHDGGFITAHTGRYFKNNEVPVIAEAGEMMIRKETAAKFPRENLEAFNRTGNVNDLGGGDQPLKIAFITSDPNATVEYYDRNFNRRKIEIERNYTSGGHPYV